MIMKTNFPRKKKLFVTTGMLLILCLLSYNSHHLQHIAHSCHKSILLFIQQATDIIYDFNFNISRNTKDVKILLWTRSNPVQEQTFIAWNEELLSNSTFNKDHSTKIFFHGFSDRPKTTWTNILRSKYFEVGEYNIFSVDWSSLAESPWYNIAAKNAKAVGEHVANFVKFLVSQGAAYENIHIIGASLGAHAAGQVGFYTYGKVGRITGLDPSGPLFHSVPAQDRLDASDALFVDVIHTAGKWVGNDDIIGHTDFFVNGGKAPQPGCEKKESLDLTCSHFMSWRIFYESISPEKTFYAIPCKSLERFNSGLCCKEKYNKAVVLGEHVNTLKTRGCYFLKTNPASPHLMPFNESIGCTL